MTGPDDRPRACCARCGARLSRADHRRSTEIPLKVSGDGQVLAWGLCCPACEGRERKATPPPSLEDLFA